MPKIEPWHRRHALQLASQLPEKIEDARLVIKATQELLEDFLAPMGRRNYRRRNRRPW
jgi:hypothetical protein